MKLDWTDRVKTAHLQLARLPVSKTPILRGSTQIFPETSSKRKEKEKQKEVKMIKSYSFSLHKFKKWGKKYSIREILFRKRSKKSKEKLKELKIRRERQSLKWKSSGLNWKRKTRNQSSDCLKPSNEITLTQTIYHLPILQELGPCEENINHIKIRQIKTITFIRTRKMMS